MRSCSPVNRGNVAKPVRMALGALIIQTRCGFTDRETVQQITENPYLQYFIGLREYQLTRTFTSAAMVNDTIWMSQKSLAELYQVHIPTINEHIKNILSDGELDKSTIREFLIVQNQGGRQFERHVKHYNFQIVLAIGYRVRSNVGIHLRNWASSVLSEYSQKGFVMNDERLKNPQQPLDSLLPKYPQRSQASKSSGAIQQIINIQKDSQSEFTFYFLPGTSS